ncbi:hypothetical protein [Nocardia sp. Marseille-Q1738]
MRCGQAVSALDHGVVVFATLPDGTECCYVGMRATPTQAACPFPAVARISALFPSVVPGNCAECVAPRATHSAPSDLPRGVEKIGCSGGK